MNENARLSGQHENAGGSAQHARLPALRPLSAEFATGAAATAVQDAGAGRAGTHAGGAGRGGGGERQVRAATAQSRQAHPHADAAYGRKSRLNLPRPHSCAPQISHAAPAADETAWEDDQVDAEGGMSALHGGGVAGRNSSIAVPRLNSSIKGRGQALQAAPSTQHPAAAAHPAISGRLARLPPGPLLHLVITLWLHTLHALNKLVTLLPTLCCCPPYTRPGAHARCAHAQAHAHTTGGGMQRRAASAMRAPKDAPSEALLGGRKAAKGRPASCLPFSGQNLSQPLFHILF